LPENPLPPKDILFEHGEIEEPTRTKRGFHSLQFNDTKVKVAGKTMTLAQGFSELEKLCNSKSPTVIAQKLIVFAYAYNHGILGQKPEKTEESPEAKTPKEKEEEK